jgi:YD repeat-containing protein
MRSGAMVDPLSLSLQLSINLGSYPGRDGLALPITMSYSSRLWGIHHVTTDKCGGFPPWTYYQRYRPEYGRGSMAGWTSPLGMSDAHGTVDLELYNFDGHPVSSGAYKKIARIFATLPDGSRHELRKDDSLHDPTETITGKFYAVDDSRLVYDTATGTLYLPDGTRMISGFIDKNGNKLVRGGSLFTDWTDTMGRSISSPLDTGSHVVGDNTSAVAFDKSFSVPGFNGGTVSYTMKWKKLEDVLTNTSDTLEHMGDTGNSGTCGAYYPPASPSLFVSTGDETQVMMETRVFDPVVLAEIDLPNGKSYNFTYNIYGEIDKVVYPTGAYDKFSHDTVPPLNPGLYDGDPFFTQTNRGVVSRTQSEDGTTGTEVTWTYGEVGRGVTNPDGTYSQIDLYPGTSSGAMKYGFESAIAGLPSEERTYTSSGTMLTRHIIERTYDSATVVSGVTATRNPRVSREISVRFEPGDSNALVSLVTYDYDSNSDPACFADLNPTVVKYYDYAVVSASTAQTATLLTLAGYFSSSASAKQVETDYLYDSNYQARNLTQIPTEVRIKDGSGNVKAKTQFYYDESSYQTTTSGTMPTAASGTWSDPTSELGSTIGSKRALPTTVRSYYDITNGYYIDTHKFYDQYGNVTKVRDGRGNDTTSAFDASYAFTLPTSVTTPVPDSSGTYGSSTAFTSSTAYDYSSGLPTSTTDINGQTTTVSYADPSTSVLDPLLRPRVITAPNGQQTITEYGDTSGSLYIKVSSQLDSTNWKAGYKYFDNLGRVKRTRSVDAAGDDYSLACYDNMGRISKVTNPFRNYSTQTCSTTTDLDWTSMTYDAEGRVTEVTTPDSAHVTTAYAASTSGTLGTTVTVTDQAGKVRRSLTDSMGRVVRVDEPDASGNLGNVSSPNQPTSYVYDVLGTLQQVTQGSQQRFFSYDSLSRLLRARNPEQAVNTNLNLTDSITGNSQWSMAYS